MIVTRLQGKYGWEELGRCINIKYFTNDPDINSSLNPVSHSCMNLDIKPDLVLDLYR
ncbi:MAG TPA: DNA-binding protein VF530 [Gammaproteobacteria bacterium]|nr:DNA-binding protein VF530 [Gammaproteobacteria bacterium]